MKVIVDMEKCEYHGQCMVAAPEVFDLRGDNELVYEPHPDDSLRDEVEEAMDACPVQAITIED
jgi:ferredoxin